MSATEVRRYDNPTFLIVREAARLISIAATGNQRAANFRSKLKALVTSITAIVESAGTATHILTLLFNGSVAAILTIGNTANANISTFTLSTNYTMADMTDLFQVSSGVNSTGKVYVIYQYKILPQDIVNFGTNRI